MIQVCKVLAGGAEIGLERTQIEGPGNGDPSAEACVAFAHGSCQNVGLVGRDAQQRLAYRGQREWLAVCLAVAGEARPHGAAPGSALVGRHSSGQPQAPELVLVLEAGALQAEAADCREAHRALGFRLAVRRSQAPVGPVGAVAQQREVGVLDFQERQHDRPAQKRQQLELHRKPPDPGQLSVAHPVRIADGDVVDDRVRLT